MLELAWYTEENNAPNNKSPPPHPIPSHPIPSCETDPFINMVLIHGLHILGNMFSSIDTYYARKCILYGFPCEMDFSPLVSESLSHPCHKWLEWESDNSIEKNPPHIENQAKSQSS